MRVPPNLVMLAVVGVAGSLLFAAESTQQAKEKEKQAAAAATPAAVSPAAAPPPQPSPAQSAGEGAEEGKKADPADKTAADKTAADKNAATAKGPSPQRFVPSEEVRPDFDVSFPIDI